MDINEWKRRAIDHLKSGNATDDQWNEVAECLLVASENEGLELLDPVLWPEEFSPNPKTHEHARSE